MKKTTVKALVAGIIFVIVFYAFQIIRGMYLTANYVPENVKSYKSVDYLQHTVTFGNLSNPVWNVLEVLGLILLGSIVFYIGRILKNKKSG